MEADPLSPSTISRYIGRYMRSLGSDSTAHMGRHRFATAIYRQTGDLLITRDLLRHRSVATTEGYSAVVAERGRTAVLAL